MDHVRLYPTRLEPARQPEAVAAGFEGQCNPRDLFTGPDRLIAPAMQQAKQPFCTRLQLLARLALNATSGLTTILLKPEADKTVLTPAARLKNEERPFPLRTKNGKQTQKQPLDRKS